MADVVRNPTLPAEELERVRAERRARVLQRADDPASVADDVFVRTVYGSAHPYGATLLGTDASLAELGREEVRAFHAHRYRPGGSTLVVVGDVGRRELEDLLESSLAAWAGTADPVPEVPGAASDADAGGTRIVLVDRPGAPQSEIRVGRAALTRRDPRYHRAAVANTILGGSFTSRLNTLLREEKGYTYGAWSWFDLRRGAGPFAAQTAVDTPVTADAVADILTEMDRLGVGPVPEKELVRARSWLAMRLPQRFESTTDVVGRLSELVLHHVPLTFYEDYVDAVLAVDADAVLSFAAHELRSQDMVVVVTGDRAAVQEPLEALGLGPVEIVPAPAGGTP
jgi:zinc protease